MPVAGESSAACRRSAVATVDAGSLCLVRPELSSARDQMAISTGPRWPMCCVVGILSCRTGVRSDGLERPRTFLRGTDGSNPSSSSGESAANWAQFKRPPMLSPISSMKFISSNETWLIRDQLTVRHKNRGSIFEKHWQQSAHDRAPQGAGAAGYHHVTIAKINPTLLFPRPRSGGARRRRFSSWHSSLRRCLRPSTATSSTWAVTRMPMGVAAKTDGTVFLRRWRSRRPFRWKNFAHA
jgi:hypothetical protein